MDLFLRLVRSLDFFGFFGFSAFADPEPETAGDNGGITPKP